METDPGPNITDGGVRSNNELRFLGIILASPPSPPARGIIHKLHLSLVPDFAFVLSQDKGKSKEEDGTKTEIKDIIKSNSVTMGIIGTTAARTETSTKPMTTEFPLSNLLVSPWSDNNRVMSLRDSLRPLNHQTSSLVSPIPSSNQTSSHIHMSPVLPDSAPLHFHRKPHYGQHEQHQSSALGPFTCSKTRKYKLLHAPNPNINDLANSLQHLTIHRPELTWTYTPAKAQAVLSKWECDYYFRRIAERQEAVNIFRGIDLNEGWNRDAAKLIEMTRECHRELPCEKGGPEVGLKIKESMNRFSFWAQLEPIEWEVDELKGMFDVVFVGEGLGNTGWSRKPGIWWGTRKKLFDGHRGRSFLEEIDLWMGEIEDGLVRWKRENKGKLFSTGTRKRKAHVAGLSSVAHVAGVAGVAAERSIWKKRVQLPIQVMSDEWRARRRAQEKRAGRWTDGTLLMDRMWEEFYWVLNEDDPDDEAWPREVFTRTYY